MGISNHAGMIIAAVVGGVIGALLFTFAYYVCIGLIGAGMGAFLLHVIWDYAKHTEPTTVAVIIASVAGAVIAMALQRYVIIVSTSFSGAWTMIVGGLALAGNRDAERAAAAGDVWILYPFTPAPGRWVVVALVRARPDGPGRPDRRHRTKKVLTRSVTALLGLAGPVSCACQGPPGSLTVSAAAPWLL